MNDGWVDVKMNDKGTEMGECIINQVKQQVINKTSHNVSAI